MHAWILATVACPLALATTGCGSASMTSQSHVAPPASSSQASTQASEIALRAISPQALLDTFDMRLDANPSTPRITEDAATKVATAMFGPNPIIDAVYANCVEAVGDSHEHTTPCWFFAFDPQRDSIMPSGPVQNTNRTPVPTRYEIVLVDAQSGKLMSGMEQGGP